MTDRDEDRQAAGRGDVVRLAREGKSAKEIAALTGVPLRTVQVKLKEARDMSDELYPVRTLALSAVTADWSINPRHERDSATVARYAEAHARRRAWEQNPGDDPEPDRLPRPVVFFDGKDYWLSRGFHRFAGAADAGLAELEFEVRTGGRRDAMVFALPDNAAHGLARSNKDLARAVELALLDPELSRLSNRELGRLLRCSEWAFRRRRAGGQAAGDAAKDTGPPPTAGEPAAANPGGGAPPGVRSERTPDAVHRRPEPTTDHPTVPAASSGDDPDPAGAPLVLPRDRLGRVLPKHLVAVFDRGAAFEAAAGKFGGGRRTCGGSTATTCSAGSSGPGRTWRPTPGIWRGSSGGTSPRSRCAPPAGATATWDSARVAPAGGG